MFQCQYLPVSRILETLYWQSCDHIVDFLKVVSTNFISLNGEEIPSHQYSVTQYERDLRTGNAPGKDAHGRKCTFLSKTVKIVEHLAKIWLATEWWVFLEFSSSEFSWLNVGLEAYESLKLWDITHESYPYRRKAILCTLPNIVSTSQFCKESWLTGWW